MPRFPRAIRRFPGTHPAWDRPRRANARTAAAGTPSRWRISRTAPNAPASRARCSSTSDSEYYPLRCGREIPVRLPWRRAMTFAPCRRRHGVQSADIAEFLKQQRLQILPRHLPEETVQTALEGFAGKTGFSRAEFQRQFAKSVIRLPPGCRHVAQHSDELFRGTSGQVTLAVALQRLTRLRQHRRRQGRFRRQVGEKVIW